MTPEQSIPQTSPQNATSQTTSPADMSPPTQAAGSGISKTWAYSGRAMRAWMIAVSILTIALVVLASFGSTTTKLPTAVVWGIPLGLAAIAWLHYAIVYCYRTMTIRYRINDFNLYYDHGLLNRTTDTMEIINIEDMQVTQTLWDRLINGGVGTVKLFCKTDRTHSGEFKMIGLEDPRGVLEIIDRVRQERRGKRTMIQV
ncbi:MAG: PH domain-containing protein [Thermoguttaceae bacterium]